MARSKVIVFVLVLAVALSALDCAAARKNKSPPRKKPEYCSKTFTVVAASTNESSNQPIAFPGAGVPERGGSFSFRLGLYGPSDNETIGNVYGSGVVMDFNSADPYARPDGYMTAFTNFNVVSRVGQVAAQGVWTEKATGSSSFVILGGTGIYIGAAGSLEMRVVDRSVYWFKIKLAQESC